MESKDLGLHNKGEGKKGQGLMADRCGVMTQVVSTECTKGIENE